MKKSVLVMALLLGAASALAGDEAHSWKTPSGWFDMENCAFCKNLVKDPALLEHLTWENHKITGGMMNITTVEPAYAAALADASAAMEALGAKIQTGKVNPMELKMCGHCMAFGELMMAGVKMETVKAKAAEVTLMTSEDPAVVAKLHALVDRDNEEMALMVPGAHHAHDHAH